jgi:hypothetical protein
MTITLSSARRHLRVALAVFAVGGGLVCLGAPSSALAGTTIGQTFVPDSGYGTGVYLQSVTPAEQYSAPSSGVITSWSFRADPTVSAFIKLKVARSAGGDDFTIVGESPIKNPVLDTLNTYAVRIPVKAGDFLGLYNDTNNAVLSRDQLGYGYHFSAPGDLPPSASPVTLLGPFGPPTGVQFDVSAVLEADCDGDKFGDETQDADTSSCNPPAPPPAAPPASTTSAPTGQRAAAKKHCKKKPKGPKRAKCLKKAKKLPV